MQIKKVIYGATTLLDLTDDTVTSQHLETGYTAHDATGEPITGTLSPSGGGSVNPQAKNATPYTTSQVILPDAGYDCLSRVSIAAISYATESNAAGGVTATIGEVAP